MHCPQCQHANPEGAGLCNACGAKLEVVCPACSQVNPPGSRFCNACGHNLAQPPAPAAGSEIKYLKNRIGPHFLLFIGRIERDKGVFDLLEAFSTLRESMPGLALVCAGELCLRYAVVKAGSQSARDPRHTVGPQRERANRNGTKVTTKR